MAKNKDPNLVTHPDGTVSDPDTEIKTPSLSDLGIDGKFIKETIKPLLKDIVIQGVRDQLGLKKSELRRNSKAYNISLFFKEVGWQLILMGLSVGMIIVFFKLLMRWVGL